MPTPNFNFPTINQSDTANVPRDLNALATSLDTAFQQTEYQTATVVGAQIRVTKPGASNRVFFRLTTAINGGTPITISTDGGATSVNLVDNDGANVTMIEKGFAEIVKVGNFFILRSKGISSAQLGELANIIGAPAVATDNFNTQLQKLQDAKDTLASKIDVASTTPIQAMADALVVGKKWASGTTTSPDTPVSFTTISGSSTNAYKIEVSGLDFTPSYIMIYGTGTNYAISCYRKATSNEYMNVVTYASSNVSTGTTVSTSVRADVLPSYVNGTGFALPISTTQSIQVNWIAFE